MATTESFSMKLPKELVRRIRRAADENERSMAGEIRFTLSRKYGPIATTGDHSTTGAEEDGGEK